MSLVARVSRHWPFANGSGRLLDMFAQNVDLGQGERLARTSDGFDLKVLAGDLIGRHLLLSGRFDRSIVQILLERAQPGDVLLDIGANIGYVSACFLCRVEGSTVVCIEPQPGVVDLLRSNMAQFDGRAIVHQVALSNSSGTLRFHVDPLNRGASRLAEDGETIVPAVHASELIGSLPRVDLIKIDVEGHELVVIEAMKGELERLRPRAILFEDHTGQAGPDGAIGSVLAGLNYQIFGVRKSLLRTSLIPVRSRDDCRFNDYLATRT